MSRTTPACVRFEAHLSENPWVLTVDGRRKMLAHRPLAGFRQVELNGVLRRYLAVCVPSSRLGSLPLAPSIEVRASGESEAQRDDAIKRKVQHNVEIPTEVARLCLAGHDAVQAIAQAAD